MPTTIQTKVPVTLRALTQRINRKLREKGEQLMVSRGAYSEKIGRYFIVRREAESNGGHYRRTQVLLKTHVELEQLAEKLDVLRPWEKLEE